MNQDNCLNCNKYLNQDAPYCAWCGQKTNTHRLSIHELSHDAVHYITHADKSIFKLLKELARRPGLVALEYIAGKRQKHFKPLNFFLIIAGIVVFMTSSLYKPNDLRSKQMEQSTQQISDPAKKQYHIQMAKRANKVSTLTGKYSNAIYMVATPFLTFIFWLFYRKRFNYIESLLANMYFIAFIMLLYALVFVPLQRIFPQFGFYFIIIFFCFEVVYRGFAYNQLTGFRETRGWIKAYGLSLLLSIIWLALTYTAIMYYIRHGF